MAEQAKKRSFLDGKEGGSTDEIEGEVEDGLDR